eukprot:234861-Pyramimonas_sp.AAC.1
MTLGIASGVQLLKLPRGWLPYSRCAFFQERKSRRVVGVAANYEPSRYPQDSLYRFHTDASYRCPTAHYALPRQQSRLIFRTKSWKGEGRLPLSAGCRALSSIPGQSEQHWLDGRWSLMEILARACEESNVDYVFVGSAAAQIQNVLPPIGEPQAVELIVQWDLANRVGTAILANLSNRPKSPPLPGEAAPTPIAPSTIRLTPLVP